MQKRELTAHAGAAGHRIRAVHQDAQAGADAARGAVLDLARAGQIDAVLVMRLSHWGRSLPDLLRAWRELHKHGVVLRSLAGPQLDLGPPLVAERLWATLDALSEVERELRQDRAHRGRARARAAGKPVGRQPRQRPKSDRLAPEVLELAAQGVSQRATARQLGLSRATVTSILRRARDL